MFFWKKTALLSFVAALTVLPVNAQVDPNFHCYLLFGQSNMAGGGAGVPIGGSGAGTLIPADCDTTSRVKVLAFCNCAAGSGAACTQYSSVRTESTWYTAFPALHICNEGVSPGDWFAKTLLDSIRSDIRIGLIPCALSGQALSVFVKGGSNFNIPNWAHPTLGNGSPYSWMLNKLQLARQTGVIKGFLLHQGENGPFTAGTWIPMAKAICDSLKKDLGLTGFFPLVIGELRQDNYAAFNRDVIDSMGKLYPTWCGVASSAGVTVQSDDSWHFNAAGMRELGRRYALALLALSSPGYIPRKGTGVVPERALMYKAMRSATGGVTVYSLSGRVVRSYSAADAGNAFRDLKAGGVYIVSRRLSDGRTAVLPCIKE